MATREEIKKWFVDLPNEGADKSRNPSSVHGADRRSGLRVDASHCRGQAVSSAASPSKRIHDDSVFYRLGMRDSVQEARVTTSGSVLKRDLVQRRVRAAPRRVMESKESQGVDDCTTLFPIDYQHRRVER